MITENVEVSERIGQLNQLYDLIVQLRMPLFSELTVAEIEITPIQKPPHGLNRILSCDMLLFCIIACLANRERPADFSGINNGQI